MNKEELEYFFARLESSTNLSITTDYGTIFLDGRLCDLFKSKLAAIPHKELLKALEEGEVF